MTGTTSISWGKKVKPKKAILLSFRPLFLLAGAEYFKGEMKPSSRLGSDNTNEIIRHDDISPFEVPERESRGYSGG